MIKAGRLRNQWLMWLGSEFAGWLCEEEEGRRLEAPIDPLDFPMGTSNGLASLASSRKRTLQASSPRGEVLGDRKEIASI